MRKSFRIALFVLAIALPVVILLRLPVIDNLIPDRLNSFITGGIIGGAAVLALGRSKKTD